MNRSEELAKLLGVSPVYSMWVNFGDLDTNYKKVWNKRKYKLISDNRGYFDNYNECPDIKREYPDFTLPENFIKLLDCFKPLEYSGIESTIDEIFWRIEKLEGSIYISKAKKLAQATKWTY